VQIKDKRYVFQLFRQRQNDKILWKKPSEFKETNQYSLGNLCVNPRGKNFFPFLAKDGSSLSP